MNNKKLGTLGEDLACQYLRRKDYKIIRRNFRKKTGEIDIIAQNKKDKVLTFFEVKTRTQDDYGQPQEAVDFFKQRKLLRTAYKYLNQNRINSNFQIDILTLKLDYSQGKAKIKHFKNVVEERW